MKDKALKVQLSGRVVVRAAVGIEMSVMFLQSYCPVSGRKEWISAGWTGGGRGGNRRKMRSNLFEFIRKRLNALGVLL